MNLVNGSIPDGLVCTTATDHIITVIDFHYISPFCALQWVACIDLHANEEADTNITVQMTDSFNEQANKVRDPMCNNRFHVSCTEDMKDIISDNHHQEQCVQTFQLSQI